MDDDLEALSRDDLIAEVRRLRGCIRYRQSLDEQAAGAPVHDADYDEDAQVPR